MKRRVARTTLSRISRHAEFKKFLDAELTEQEQWDHLRWIAKAIVTKKRKGQFTDVEQKRIFESFSDIAKQAKIDFIGHCDRVHALILVRWFKEIYRDIANGQIDDDYADFKLKSGAKMIAELSRWDLQNRNLEFLMATKAQITEVGGPKEMATLNVAILLNFAQRSLHNFPKQVERWRNDKDRLAETKLLAEILSGVFNVGRRNAVKYAKEIIKE